MNMADAIAVSVFFVTFFPFLAFLMWLLRTRSNIPERPTSTERLVNQFLERPWPAPTWKYEYTQTVTRDGSSTCGFCGRALTENECKCNSEVAPLVTPAPVSKKEVN